ncbi:MAG TPA: hypothetical protein ENI20_11240 [Bacteroides sp.]|nr:hypothetical protein [Bacteroides sp.]
MNKTTLKANELDKIYSAYNYEIKSRKHRSVRVYVKKVGIYSAAEIIPLHKEYNYAKIQKEYSELGYATRVRDFQTIDQVENLLFKEYFLDSQFYQINSTRYDEYETKQMNLLPEGSKYEFIEVPYDFLIYENSGEMIDKGQSAGHGNNNIVKRLLEWIDYEKKPVFIIIEAAAGFGKTCIAFEVLRELVGYHDKLVPFFIELSKNRDARVFRHILLNEIENHFPEGINSSIVLNEITKGNIPLMIDGFDELLSKDLSKGSKIESNVGNMLSTIMELLTDKSNLLITSRKTAIFDGESFNDWASSISTNFIIARFILKEPSIVDWLGSDKIKIFNNQEYDINKLANPVVLTYLRNIDKNSILDLISNEEHGLFRKYFEFLLNREKIRQNLFIEIDDQIKIFRNLARFMVELDFRADTKEGIKDFFRAYCKEEIESCINNYPKTEKPSLEDLVETLSNHLFLDRKEQGFIGFINDFIFGSLIAESLVLNEFKLKDKNSESYIGEANCELAVEAYKINNEQNGKKLWKVFTNSNFQFLHEFYFLLDIIFMRCINRNYKNLQIESRLLFDVKFINHNLSNIQFIRCQFTRCDFDPNLISNTTFQNCSFTDCETVIGNNWDDSVVMEKCQSNNNLTKLYVEKPVPLKQSEGISNYNEVSIHGILLRLFFNSISGAPKNTSKRQIFASHKEDDPVHIKKGLKDLVSKGFLHPQGDMYFISKEGRSYYNKIK